MFLLIWIFYIGSVNSLSDNSSKLCFLVEGIFNVFCNNSSTELSCSDDHLIRIKDIQIEITSKSSQMYDCGKCPPNDEPDEWKNETDITPFETLLYQSCSGKSICTFTSDVNTNIRYIWTANVKYDCVEKESFKDICSTWTQKTDSVHIYLNKPNIASKICSCTIEGDTEKTQMAIVDYRPYTGNSSCAGSSVIVDGEDMFQCTENGTYFSVFKKNITIINNVTKIAVSFSYDLPQMLWIHVKGINVTVQCNYENISPTFYSTSSPTDIISTDPITILPGIDTMPTYAESSTSTTIRTLLNERNQDEKSSSLPVIAGCTAGLLALVIIAVIICFLYRRKSNFTAKGRVMENMHTEYNAQPNITKTTRIGNGWDTNQGGEPVNKMVNIKMKNNSDSNYEEVGEKKGENDDDGDSKEYAEPADFAVDIINAETKTTGIQVSLKVRNKIEQHYNKDTYEDLVISNENQNNYDKLLYWKYNGGS